MTKDKIREVIEKSWESGYITDEENDALFDSDEFGIDKFTGTADEWWAQNRNKLRDAEGWVKLNKDYKENKSLEDQIQDYIGDLEVEDLSEGDIQDIANDLEVDVSKVNEGIEKLQIREMKKQLDRADKENYGSLEKGKQTELSNREVSEQRQRAEDLSNSPFLSKMANDYTVRRYLEGASTPELIANEAAAKIGAAADFVPTWVPYAGQVAPFVSPTVRFLQGAMYDSDDENYSVGRSLAKAAEDAAFNYGAGAVVGGGLGKQGAKLGAKNLGDAAASLAGQQGRVGKIVGDVIEEKASKYPKAVSTIGTGVTRKKLQGSNLSDLFEDEKTKKVVKGVEDKFNKAVKETISEYKKDWEKGYYIPEESDSDVLKEAYSQWLEEQKEK